MGLPSGAEGSPPSPPLTLERRLSKGRYFDDVVQIGEPFLTPIDAAASASIILPSSPGLRRRRVATKTIRLRDKEHCKFVASQPCIVCGRTRSEPIGRPRTFGRSTAGHRVGRMTNCGDWPVRLDAPFSPRSIQYERRSSSARVDDGLASV